jgi:AcrR family transcriptional regulator
MLFFYHHFDGGISMSITEERKKELELQRRSQIQNAALNLFFKNNYKNTSMADIAKEAGISKGLIYHYFQNKQELLLSFQDKVMECLNEINLLPTYTETLMEFGKRFLLLKMDESGYIPPLQILTIAAIKGDLDQSAQDKSPFLKMVAEEYLTDVFQKGIDANEFKPGDPTVYSNIFWNYLVGRLMLLLHTNDDSKTEQDLKNLFSTFLRSV